MASSLYRGQLPIFATATGIRNRYRIGVRNAAPSALGGNVVRPLLHERLGVLEQVIAAFGDLGAPVGEVQQGL